MALKVSKQWSYRGKRCVIIKHAFGHFCAYVESAEVRSSYSVMPLDCHGGLTFSGELKILGDGRQYLGMDFVHAGDYCPAMKQPPQPGEKVWTIGEVTGETEHLADAVLAIEAQEMQDKWKSCPYCGKPLTIEDHFPVGGPKKYWSCDSCGQEQHMFRVGK